MRLLVALPLLLAGCTKAQDPASDPGVDINAAAADAQNSIRSYADATATPPPVPVPVVIPSPVASPVLPPLDPPAPGTPGGLPDDRTPIAEGPIVKGSAQDAANVVQTYYALLGEKNYPKAWALWGHGGKDSGLTVKAFTASFDTYSEYHANIGAPGDVDAGMSQRWVTVPVQVYARLKIGTPVYMLGTVKLHRVAEGGSDNPADQLWRISSVDFKPAAKK